MSQIKRKTIIDIKDLKGKAPIVCLTSYTAPFARIVDRHADVILVGDSLGMVLYGYNSTLPVSLDLMAEHGRAVVKATEQALIVVDLPFGSYESSPEQAFKSAVRLMKDTSCTAVKLEGGAYMEQTVSFLVQRGVPVMGHIGILPQSVHGQGGFKVKGKDPKEKSAILEDAQALERAGAFAVVVEGVTCDVAEEVTNNISIPTIGIGASLSCDGQVLVAEDILGLTSGHKPKFVKVFADLGAQVEQAVSDYATEVRTRRFPDENYLYAVKK